MGTVTLPGIVKATAEEAGCWISGANWGWRGTLRVIQIALLNGWTLDTDDRALFDLAWDGATIDDETYTLPSGQTIIGDSIWEAVHEMSDDAVTWLDANVAPDGYTYGWSDGDFMLWSTADWCVNSGDACFCEPGEGCCE